MTPDAKEMIVEVIEHCLIKINIHSKIGTDKDFARRIIDNPIIGSRIKDEIAFLSESIDNALKPNRIRPLSEIEKSLIIEFNRWIDTRKDVDARNVYNVFMTFQAEKIVDKILYYIMDFVREVKE